VRICTLRQRTPNTLALEQGFVVEVLVEVVEVLFRDALAGGGRESHGATVAVCGFEGDARSGLKSAKSFFKSVLGANLRSTSSLIRERVW
jgi:hypothetical protein